MNIYVGNLSFKSTDEDLRRMFEEFGEVSRTSIVRDRETGNSRGFGFVEMASDDEGQAAIDALNGKEMGGRTLNVNVARPREDRPRGGGGGRGQGRGGRGDY